MTTHLLDTSVCVHLIRGRSQTMLSRLARCPLGSVAISTTTFAELQYGVAKSSDPSRNDIALKHFCALLGVIAFDNKAASTYGDVRAQLERSGTPIGPLDTLIAAHAMSLGVTLVTTNEAEFRRVAGLQVDNWQSV